MNNGHFPPRDDSSDPVIVIMKLAAEDPDRSLEVNNLMSLVVQTDIIEILTNALVLEEKMQTNVSLLVGLDELAE